MENTLKQIEILSQLVELWQKHQSSSIYNNFYLLKPVIKGTAEPRRVLYEENPRGLVCFLDYETHYKLIFSRDVRENFAISSMDKEICCEYITPVMHGEEVYREFQSFFLKNGFNLDESFRQLRYVPGAAYSYCVSAQPEDAARLETLGLQLRRITQNEIPAVQTLIASELNQYDIMGYSPREWTRQIEGGNILGLFRAETLVAVYCFADDGSRLTLYKEYRRHGLGSVLYRAMFSQPHWNGHLRLYDEWINPDNIASTRMVAFQNQQPTGKMKYRYIKTREG